MTKAEPKPKKLPKVWVAVNERGTVLSFGMSKSFLTGLFELREGESIHQYAPVQKPKRCMCKEPFSGPLCLYCANCGGKIVTNGDKR